MNTKNVNILKLSIAITIVGFLIDSDMKEPSVMMRFIEFFAMIGIIFMILFSISSLVNFTKNKINLLRN